MLDGCFSLWWNPSLAQPPPAGQLPFAAAVDFDVPGECGLEVAGPMD